jgi:hypothetical protein
VTSKDWALHGHLGHPKAWSDAMALSLKARNLVGKDPIDFDTHENP